MAKKVEIERKFLVQTLPAGWKRSSHSRIVQGYFPIRGNRMEVRLRRRGKQFFLTVKGGHGETRLEEEIRISPRRFLSLWPFTRGSRISKIRYLLPFRGKTIELDFYHGVHRGLITAEVEFTSKHESRSFNPPDWFGDEITGMRKYSNRLLSQKGSP